jgi:hypothetical protein
MQVRLLFPVIALCQLLVTSFDRIEAQENNIDRVRFMFYNVENLFDTYNDTLTNDEDFLPEGSMRWNTSRYWKKIEGIYKTIVAAGEWSPPQVVAFCEIENRKVLEDLITGTYLSKYEFKIVHQDSPDRRGIDVCLIYRNDRVKLIDYRYLIPCGLTEDYFRTRTILYARLGLDQDTIHFFVNHWPSRRGGVLTGEKLRIRIAEMIRMKVDSIILKEPAAKIIVMGDFNCNPGDREIEALIASDTIRSPLVNLSEALLVNKQGTYKYLGVWEMIDQVIVSESLLTGKKGYTLDKESLHIYGPDFLLKDDRKYSGLMPFATYRGYLYQGGFSDHLPLLLDMRRATGGQQE